MEKDFFKEYEEMTGVNVKEIVDVASLLQSANFEAVEDVRCIVNKVSKITGKNVSKEVEDAIVDKLVADGEKVEFATISDMLINTQEQ